MVHFYFFSLLSLFITWEAVCAGDEDVHFAHMKPFGTHMPAESVDEFFDGKVPSPQDFWTKYVNKRRPVVFRKAARTFPAFAKWTDEFLADQFGDLEVRLEARKEKQGYIPEGDLGIGRDTIRNFIKTYHSTNKYIVSELPIPMYNDIMVLAPLACGEFSKRIVEVDWWMNGGNASSIIHKDAFNQINCLINGTKEWKLIEYKYEKSIYKAWEPEKEIGGYSRVNPEKVDLVKYPKIATVPWMFTTLHGGDCLYLPGSMYHQVKSYGTNNFAVSLLFSRFDNRKELDFSDCGNDSLSQSLHKELSSFDVDWQYPGTGAMTMGEPDLEFIRSGLYSLVQRRESFVDSIANIFLKEVYEGKTQDWLQQKAEEVYDQVSNIVGKAIDEDTIRSMPKEALRIFALAVQPIDASNTYDHEYAYVSPNSIVALVEHMLNTGGKLERAKFVKRYQKEAMGTAKFANEFFDRLAGEAATEATKYDVKKNMKRALEKYSLHQPNELEVPKGETVIGDAYDNTNMDTENFETGMPDLSDESQEIHEDEEDPEWDINNGAGYSIGKDEL